MLHSHYESECNDKDYIRDISVMHMDCTISKNQLDCSDKILKSLRIVPTVSISLKGSIHMLFRVSENNTISLIISKRSIIVLYDNNTLWSDYDIEEKESVTLALNDIENLWRWAHK